MRNLSDLTKDTRLSLEEILANTIHDVIDVDTKRPNDDVRLVEYENRTFYYRVIFLFIQRVVMYYTNDEIEKWCRTELLEEAVLPKIDEYKKSNHY